MNTQNSVETIHESPDMSKANRRPPIFRRTPVFMCFLSCFVLDAKKPHPPNKSASLRHTVLSVVYTIFIVGLLRWLCIGERVLLLGFL